VFAMDGAGDAAPVEVGLIPVASQASGVGVVEQGKGPVDYDLAQIRCRLILVDPAL